MKLDLGQDEDQVKISVPTPVLPTRGPILNFRAVIHSPNLVVGVAVFGLMPRDDAFFDFFERAAANMLECCKLLDDFMSRYTDI